MQHIFNAEICLSGSLIKYLEQTETAKIWFSDATWSYLEKGKYTHIRLPFQIERLLATGDHEKIYVSLFVFHLLKTNKIHVAAIMMKLIREMVMKQNLTLK